MNNYVYVCMYNVLKGSLSSSLFWFCPYTHVSSFSQKNVSFFFCPYPQKKCLGHFLFERYLWKLMVSSRVKIASSLNHILETQVILAHCGPHVNLLSTIGIFIRDVVIRTRSFFFCPRYVSSFVISTSKYHRQCLDCVNYYSE